MVKKNYHFLFKVLLVGDAGVDKVSKSSISVPYINHFLRLSFFFLHQVGLIFRFGHSAFSTINLPAIGVDFAIKTIEIAGQKIKLQIWQVQLVSIRVFLHLRSKHDTRRLLWTRTAHLHRILFRVVSFNVDIIWSIHEGYQCTICDILRILNSSFVKWTSLLSNGQLQLELIYILQANYHSQFLLYD
jgi:hypothetical protein